MIGLSKGGPIMEKKTCKKCGEEKPIEDFRTIKSGRQKGWIHSKCRKCCAAQVADWERRHSKYIKDARSKWRSQNPHRILRYGMRRYGVDEVWYLDRLEEQGHVCAICKRDEPTDSPRARLSVDHCHKTSKLRGLLCNTCNMRLAGLEAHDWLASAMAYLEKYKT